MLKKVENCSLKVYIATGYYSAHYYEHIMNILFNISGKFKLFNLFSIAFSLQ